MQKVISQLSFIPILTAIKQSPSGGVLPRIFTGYVIIDVIATIWVIYFDFNIFYYYYYYYYNIVILLYTEDIEIINICIIRC